MVSGLPRAFWFLWAGTFVTRLGSFVLPYLALYLTGPRGLSLSRAGLFIALYGAGGAVAAPLGGFLADRVGRRFTLLLSLTAGGAGMVALGFIQRLEWLAPAIFLVALMTEMYRPAMQATVSDLVPAHDRVRAFGLVYWVINVGFAVGLTVGGILASRHFLWLFLGDGLTTLAFAGLILAGVPESRPAAAERRHGDGRPTEWQEFLAPYRDRHFAVFLTLSFLYALIFLQNATTFAVDMTSHGLSKAEFGRVLALNGLIIVLVQPFLGPLLSRLDRSRTLAVGAALTGIGFGLNAVVHTLPLYAFGVMVWTVGEMGVLPVANAVVADFAPVVTRGRYQGAYGLSFGLASCAAPALGLAAYERAGPAALWLGCLCLGLGIAAGHLALGAARAKARRVAR
jgi:MFS family permease